MTDLTELASALTADTESAEARRLLLEYSTELHAEADAEAQNGPEASNRANIQVAFKLASLYAQVPQCREVALRELEDVRLAASQQPSTADLLAEANKIIDKLLRE